MTASDSPVRAGRERVLSFQGGCNFRDIGGYRTQHGSNTRWGKVYRAGVLTYFTDDDHAPLNKLQVRAICDLRRTEEREREPTRWPDTTTNALSWDDGVVIPTIRALSADRPKNAAGMFDAMVALYRALPEWMAGRIAGMFDAIARGNIPMVVHCAAGKDRTGVAVAVLLRALDIPEQTVIDDYLLTNTAGDFEAFIRSRHQAQMGVADNHTPLLSMPEDMRRVLFSADPAFLQAAFEQIDGELGGVDGYLRRTVGLSDETLGRVRSELLE